MIQHAENSRSFQLIVFATSSSGCRSPPVLHSRQWRQDVSCSRHSAPPRPFPGRLRRFFRPAYALHAQAVQKQDSVYTAAIHQYLTDPRITTELVDHLPASATVPTPLKALGHIIGQPGYLTHTADIHKYMRAIAAAAPNRAKVISLGTTEEGREMIAMVIFERRDDEREHRQIPWLHRGAHGPAGRPRRRRGPR